ncbi:hypothetical protein V1477_019870 [Vespula maculifrons]|uniref:Uncharacterized protein n=1 Tax=Vespula maculifrons TaxID=7453 RepID=A0ABD2AKF2_VESMC
MANVGHSISHALFLEVDKCRCNEYKPILAPRCNNSWNKNQNSGRSSSVIRLRNIESQQRSAQITLHIEFTHQFYFLWLRIAKKMSTLLFLDEWVDINERYGEKCSMLVQAICTKRKND